MSTPYPIYFNKRPVRTAFLVNPKEFTCESFSKIFDFNLNKYNGRFNPVVFTDGKNLTNEGWEFLKYFDPDVIKILLKPEKVLLQKIEDWLSPYVVETQDSNEHISGYGQDISINKPTKDLISRLSSIHAYQPSTFVLFNIKNITDDKQKQFVHFNFGTYDEWMIEHIGEKVDPKQIFNLDTSESINVALGDLSKMQKHPVYPVQLSTFPNNARDVEYNHGNEQFTVIVGNSPYDLVHYWNRSLSVPHWLRPDICHIWLPAELAEDEKLKEGLQLYFQRRAAQVGNSNNGKYIKFVSFSLTEKRLKKIADSLGEKVWAGKRVEVLKPTQVFPDYGLDKNYFSVRQGMELYQAYSNEENIVINDLQLPEGVQGGNWMLDVHIQYRPERYSYTNIRHWWRLPNRNHIAHSFFPNKIARIQKNGIPSVLMETKSSFRPDESNLTIKIPEDRDIIRLFIYGHNRPIYTGDPRASLIDNKTYFNTSRSDKGRYLDGLVGLFGGLWPAFSQFREPFWGNVFEMLALSDKSNEEAKKRNISNKLHKSLKAIPKNKTERNNEIKWLTEYILRLSKEHGKLGREITFSVFLSERIKQLQEALQKEGRVIKLSKNRIKEIKEDIEEDIEKLVERNILLVGVKPHCPFCGYSNWYQINEIRQKSECRGCGNVFNLPPEQPWFYRLNNLVQDGVSQHGLIPVLLTLGELYDSARSSFIYSTSLDLHQRLKRGKEKHLGDLDIVCIQDGKFIMGEIKQDSDLFQQKHFKEALKLAKKIKPNVLIFASLDGKNRSLIDDNIRVLKEKLEPLGIEVWWYKPTPITYIYN
jgi:hypothetical protein